MLDIGPLLIDVFRRKFGLIHIIRILINYVVTDKFHRIWSNYKIITGQ